MHLGGSLSTEERSMRKVKFVEESLYEKQTAKVDPFRDHIFDITKRLEEKYGDAILVSRTRSMLQVTVVDKMRFDLIYELGII